MHQITQIITFHLFLGQLVAQAQNQPHPQVGDTCPSYTFKNVRHYTADQISTTSFIGEKWLVLDFWGKTCRYCIETFPKLNEWQQEFGADIQFLLVGNNGGKYNKGIEVMYEKQRQQMDLRLAVAYDSTLKKTFAFKVIPHVVIVDKQGKIYAITGANELSREKLKALVEGRKPVFEFKEY